MGASIYDVLDEEGFKNTPDMLTSIILALVRLKDPKIMWTWHVEAPFLEGDDDEEGEDSKLILIFFLAQGQRSQDSGDFGDEAARDASNFENKCPYLNRLTLLTFVPVVHDQWTIFYLLWPLPS